MLRVRQGEACLLTCTACRLFVRKLTHVPGHPTRDVSIEGMVALNAFEHNSTSCSSCGMKEVSHSVLSRAVGTGYSGSTVSGNEVSD